MPKVKSPATHAHNTNRYNQGFGNSFSFYNRIWGKIVNTEVILGVPAPAGGSD